VFALQSGVASRLRAAWERERAGGSVRAIEPAFLANAWLGLVNHYLVHRDLFAPGEQVLARHGDALRAQFLQLIHVEVPRD
jgi:hypothetical protein